MTRHIYILLLMAFCCTESQGAVECDAGWVSYKDELCIQPFPTLLTFTEAKDFCSQQDSATSKSSLVMVKDSDLQDFLVNYTSSSYDHIWLGGRFDEVAGQFKWEDGSPLTYTNWKDGSPRKDSNSDTCIELKPINAKVSKNGPGKWIDANCNKRNMVMCQKVLSWTLEHAIQRIIRLEKQLEIVNSRVVPVGSIYIEYYSQPSPPDLWPDLTWEDVTSTYAGLFFRAAGGKAAAWGIRQTECAPRITRTYHSGMDESRNVKNPLDIPASGESEFGLGGYYYIGTGTLYHEGIKFTTAGCEVRPVNQAVRIWKRTA